MFIHRLAALRARWQLDVQNYWALRHRQAFLPVSRKQNPVHLHTEILSRPGCAATSMSLSSISPRVKLTSMMAGDKNFNFTLCKTSRIGTFHKVVHDLSSFQNKKPAQYGLEINFKLWCMVNKIYKNKKNSVCLF